MAKLNTTPTNNAEFQEIARMLGISATPEEIERSSAYEMAEWEILSRIPGAASETGERLRQIKLALRFFACSEIIQKDRSLMDASTPGEVSNVIRSISRTQGEDSEQITYENADQLSVSESADVFKQNAEQILDALAPTSSESDGTPADAIATVSFKGTF